MNMSLRKKDLIQNNLFFDEEFLAYGMEDNYFGLEAVKKVLKFIQIKQVLFIMIIKVFHYILKSYT